MAETTLDHDGPIVTRQEAIVAMSTRYFTGRRCKQGHRAERLVSNRTCCICLEEKSKTRKSRPAAKARINTSRRESRKVDLESARRKSREYYAKNRSKLASRMREYRAKNPDNIRATKKKTYSKTYSKILVRNRNRRARERNAEGFFTDEDIARIRKAQRDRCAVCRKPLNGGGHADHIIALAKGGTNWPSNIQLLCGPCNSKKYDKDPIEFMQSLGYLL